MANPPGSLAIAITGRNRQWSKRDEMWSVLASGFGILEAPTLGTNGSVYFSDVTRGGVFAWTSAATEVSVVLPKRRGVGGMAVHRDGGVVVSGRDLRHVGLGPDRVLLTPDDVSPAEGLSTSFNDFAAGPGGEVYIGTVRTAPGHIRGDGELFGRGELLAVDAPGSARPILVDVVTSNGAVYADGMLLHADSTRQRINRLPITGEGDPTFFSTEQVEGVPDGMALDAEGNLWIAFYGGGCLGCFSVTGKLLRVLDVPASRVTNLCFGSSEPVLYVTTEDNTADATLGGCLLAADTDVTGAPVPTVGI